jgi:hypothetical protein
LDTKNFSDYIGPSPNTKSDNKSLSSGLPSYTIAIMVVIIILALLTVGYLVYRKRRNSKSKKENKVEPLQEVWAAPKNAIFRPKAVDNTGAGWTDNTMTNKSLLNSDIEGGNKDPDASRMTHFYSDLSYFQHEVDIEDIQVINLTKDQSSKHN